MSVPEAEDKAAEAQLEQLFRAARRDHDPSAADRAAVERALMQRLGSAMSTTAAVGSARAPWSSGVGVWFVAAAFTVVGVTVGYSLLGNRESSPVLSPPKRPAPEAPVPADTSTSDVTRPEPDTRALPPSSVRESSHSYDRRRVAQPRAAPSSPAIEDNASVAVRTRHPSGPPTHPRPGGELHRAPRSSAEPEPLQTSAEVVRRVESTAPTLQARVAPGPDREPEQSELAFMRRVHAALGEAEFGHVLDLCAEHKRRWPRGAFEPEREGVRALALCALGLPDSRDNARAYFSRFTQSPLTPRIRATCKLPLHSTPASRAD